MQKRALVPMFICFFIFLLIIPDGCRKNEGTGSLKSDSGVLTVMTSFYPVYISTINVTKGIDSVEVINMTSAQTGCLHDYQLKPSDLTGLEKADVFIINGAGMEEFLSDVVNRLPDLVIVDTSKGIDLLKDSNNITNAHIWVDISNAMAQVRNIADGLAAADSRNAVSFKSNASVYLSGLADLLNKAEDELSSLKTRDIVTFHEAFVYFAEEFNLNIVSVIERDPNSTPTAKELENTISIINKSDSKVVFTEPQYSSKSAQMIAEQTGAKIYELDPVVSGDSDPGAINDYIDAMNKNIMTLKEALG